MPPASDKRQAQDYDAGGPDIGSEMQSVGLRAWLSYLVGNAVESAGTPEVDCHGDEHHGRNAQTEGSISIDEKTGAMTAS